MLQCAIGRGGGDLGSHVLDLRGAGVVSVVFVFDGGMGEVIWTLSNVEWKEEGMKEIVRWRQHWEAANTTINQRTSISRRTYTT